MVLVNDCQQELESEATILSGPVVAVVAVAVQHTAEAVAGLLGRIARQRRRRTRATRGLPHCSAQCGDIIAVIVAVSVIIVVIIIADKVMAAVYVTFMATTIAMRTIILDIKAVQSSSFTC